MRGQIRNWKKFQIVVCINGKTNCTTGKYCFKILKISLMRMVTLKDIILSTDSKVGTTLHESWSDSREKVKGTIVFHLKPNTSRHISWLFLMLRLPGANFCYAADIMTFSHAILRWYGSLPDTILNITLFLSWSQYLRIRYARACCSFNSIFIILRSSSQINSVDPLYDGHTRAASGLYSCKLSKLRSGGIIPCISYKGMCRPQGYCFWAVLHGLKMGMDFNYFGLNVWKWVRILEVTVRKLALKKLHIRVWKTGGPPPYAPKILSSTPRDWGIGLSRRSPT